MKPWAKAAVQGAACGLVLGFVLLVIGVPVWRSQVAAVQTRQAGIPDVLKARRFELLDAEGKLRAVLDVTMNSSGLLLLDAAGKLRSSLLVLPDGSVGLTLGDPAGEPRATLLVLPDGTPALALRDAAGKLRASAAVRPDGSPSLALYDAAFNDRAVLRLKPEGSPSLALRDHAGHPRAVLGAAELETAKPAEVKMRPESSLVFFDKDRKVIWQAPSP